MIVDRIMHIKHLPEPGGDIVATASYEAAGGAMNSLLAAARDGMETIYCGLVGSGSNANIISEALTQAGITTYFPTVADEDNGYCVALIDEHAERTFITSVGVEGRFSITHLKEIKILAGDFVYVSGYSLATPENAEGLATWLPRIPPSATVFVDPSPLVAELPFSIYAPLLARCDILSANEREAAAIIAAHRKNNQHSAADEYPNAAVTLSSLLPQGSWAIIRNGSKPTQLCKNDGMPKQAQSIPTYPQHAVDTNGCGDVHAGVLLSSLSSGLDMEEAVKRANAAAAIKATRSGPDSAPTHEEIDMFVQKNMHNQA